MPAKSSKQLKWAYAVKEGKVEGVDKSVGREMIKKTPKKKQKALLKKKTKK